MSGVGGILAELKPELDIRRLVRLAALAIAVTATAACHEARQPEHMRVIELRGDPYERGFQHGAAFGSEIRSLYTQMLATSLLPYLNREQPDIVEVLPRYAGPEYADGRFSYQLMVDSGEAMLEHMPPEYVEELQGIADGAGLPFDQVLVHNTYVDTMLALRAITFFIRGLQGPALVEVSLDLDADGSDNDGDGEVDEEGEGVIAPWDPSPHASLVEVPTDTAVRLVLEDIDGLAALAGEESTGGEGIDPDSVRIQVDTEVFTAVDPEVDTRSITSAEGREQLEVTFTPADGFAPASVVSISIQASDLAWVTDPPPAHARNMRFERVVLTTEGTGAAPEDVDNRGERDGITQPPSHALAVRGTATPDGLPRIGYHFSMLDANTAHRHAAVFLHIPDDGEPFVVLGWTGILWGFTGMNSRGLAYGVTTSDTLDNGMVIDVLVNMASLEDARLVVQGVPMGVLGREVLSRCATVDEAADLLEASVRTFGWDVVLGDAEGGILVAEMDSDILGTGTGFHRITVDDEGPAGRSSVRADDLRTASHFMANVDDFDVPPMQPQRFWSSFYFRSLRAFYVLGERIDERYGDLDTTAIVEVLRDPDLVDPRDSMVAVVYEPAVPALHVSMGVMPATDGEFRTFDLGEWLGGGAR
jgi:hypothetical protein